MLALSCVCVGIGLAPALLWPLMARVAASWQPSLVEPEVPAPLMTLGWTQIALAALVLAAAIAFVRKLRVAGLERKATWDCGYAGPTARMQYTSVSFSAIVSGWFGWILLPEKNARRPRGPFPPTAFRLERFPETMLERIIGPIGDTVMRASSAVRALQHGRLQFYILYVVAGLIALGGLAIWGGAQ